MHNIKNWTYCITLLKFLQSKSILNRPTTMEAALREHNTHKIHLFSDAVEYISEI